MANQLGTRTLPLAYAEPGRPPGLGQRRPADHPDAGTDNAPAVDCVIVCGGVGIQRSVTREHVTFLQAQARQGRRLGAVCTGSWALARAGLLDGYDCSVHWECLAAMQEAFPGWP